VFPSKSGSKAGPLQEISTTPNKKKTTTKNQQTVARKLHVVIAFIFRLKFIQES
jgi:hypothetical protein